jgi:hypothetical protein
VAGAAPRRSATAPRAPPRLPRRRDRHRGVPSHPRPPHAHRLGWVRPPRTVGRDVSQPPRQIPAERARARGPPPRGPARPARRPHRASPPDPARVVPGAGACTGRGRGCLPPAGARPVLRERLVEPAAPGGVAGVPILRAAGAPRRGDAVRPDRRSGDRLLRLPGRLPRAGRRAWRERVGARVSVLVAPVDRATAGERERARRRRLRADADSATVAPPRAARAHRRRAGRAAARGNRSRRRTGPAMRRRPHSTTHARSGYWRSSAASSVVASGSPPTIGGGRGAGSRSHR